MDRNDAPSRPTVPYIPPAESITESIERHLRDADRRGPRVATTLPMMRPVRPTE